MAGGYAMTREAAEAKWLSGPSYDVDWTQVPQGDRRRHTHQPEAAREPAKKTVKDFPFLELAGGAFAIASKVSKEVYEVDTLYGILMRGGRSRRQRQDAGAAEGQVHAGRPAAGRLPDRDGQPPRAPRRGARRLAQRGRHVRRCDHHRRHHLRRRRRGFHDVGEVEAVPRRGRRRARRPPLGADRRVPRGRARAGGPGVRARANGKGSTVGMWRLLRRRDQGRREEREGTWTSADGNKYVGQWKDDKIHGEGTLIYATTKVRRPVQDRQEHKAPTPGERRQVRRPVQGQQDAGRHLHLGERRQVRRRDVRGRLPRSGHKDSTNGAAEGRRSRHVLG